MDEFIPKRALAKARDWHLYHLHEAARMAQPRFDKYFDSLMVRIKNDNTPIVDKIKRRIAMGRNWKTTDEYWSRVLEDLERAERGEVTKEMKRYWSGN